MDIDKPVYVADHRLIRFADIVAGTVPGRATASMYGQHKLGLEPVGLY
ncbi:MAG: hypothetical protein KIT16_06635 [Rhodospirillaceae bacterium]|nr:hypothetical protein [Rhodospirillaceae bacterium]